MGVRPKTVQAVMMPLEGPLEGMQWGPYDVVKVIWDPRHRRAKHYNIHGTRLADGMFFDTAQEFIDYMRRRRPYMRLIIDKDLEVDKDL